MCVSYTSYLVFILFYFILVTGALLWDVSHFSSVVQSRVQGETDWPVCYAALVHYIGECGLCPSSQTDVYECDLLLPAADPLTDPLADPLDSNASHDCTTDTAAGFVSVHYSGRLGLWLKRQFTARDQGKLSQEREAALQVLVDQGSSYFSSNLALSITHCSSS
jgi:hypothetical protein